MAKRRARVRRVRRTYERRVPEAERSTLRDRHRREAVLRLASRYVLITPKNGGFNEGQETPPVRYIPGTSLTLYSGHMVYTLAYLPQQGVPYAVEGDQCHGREDQVYRPSSM